MMSEPKTLREWVRKHLPAVVYDALAEAKHRGNCEPHISQFLGYHIIPGADVVVREAALLAAGHAYEDAARAGLDTGNYEAGLIAGARACLEAAGIECVDEVVSLRVPGGRKGDANGDLPIRLGSGDILYIKRGD